MFNLYDVKVEYKGDVQWHNLHAFDGLEAARNALYLFRQSRRLYDTRRVPDSAIEIDVTFITECE